jgi:hypothetical protein
LIAGEEVVATWVEEVCDTSEIHPGGAEPDLDRDRPTLLAIVTPLRGSPRKKHPYGRLFDPRNG